MTEEIRKEEQEEIKKAAELRDKILNWLLSDAGTHLRTDHKNGTGFSVFEKDRVKTKNGVMSVTDMLAENGFVHNMIVGDYRVVHQDGGRQYPESFAFFLSRKPVEMPEF